MAINKLNKGLPSCVAAGASSVWSLFLVTCSPRIFVVVVGAEKRTSAAKAGHSSVIYGTAEAVPFLQDRVFTQTLKPNVVSIVFGPTKVVS